jgi:hypothetical protein
MKITYFAHAGGMTTEGVDDAPRRLTEDQLRTRYPWPHFQHVQQLTNAQWRANHEKRSTQLS